MARGQGPSRKSQTLRFRALVRRAAERDLEAIEDWAESRRDGLASDFRRTVDEAIARVIENPLVYADLHRGNRRILLRQFKYELWFRIVDNDVVFLACVQGHRDPRFVRSQLARGM